MALHADYLELEMPELAEHLLHEAGQSGDAPTNPSAILQYLSLQFAMVDLGTILPGQRKQPRGVLSYADRIVGVDVSLRDSTHRARFTTLHEVGHYLSDRIGLLSEGYTEDICSRFGFCEETPTTVRPEAEGDIMGTLSGTVRHFSLSGILDDAIDEHEQELEVMRRRQQFEREMRAYQRLLEGDPETTIRFLQGFGGYY